PRIDTGMLIKDMVGAARTALAARWSEAEPYARAEFRKIAHSIELIERQYPAGEITRQEARLHMAIQRNASPTVLLTIEGIGLLAAEAALNAALNAIRKAVNTAIGFVLI